MIFGGSSGRVQSGRVRPDPYPRIRPAGSVPFGTEDNADHCIRQDVHLSQQPDRPSTPEHLKKYRKSVQGEPGVRQVHPGMMDDIPAVNYQRAFGRRTNESDPVQGVIKAQNLSGLADRFNDLKEQKYASHVREPLGRGYQRGYQQMPAETQTSSFSYGVPSGQLQNAKDLIYPQGGAMEERPQTAKMYEKTHGDFAAGAQRKRNYAWEEVDPDQQRFGFAEGKLLNGVAQAVHKERFEESFPKTVIVKKEVEDFRGTNQDQLGKVRNLGQGFHPLPQDHTFGVTQDLRGQWNAAKCIQGEPSDRELQPDNDLGRCTKAGSRNMLRSEADRDRVFGCPTIRTDIPFKETKSVADFQNYGDEPEAVDLLFPATLTEIGVEERDFRQPRSRTEIRSLFANIGYSYKPGKFNAIYNRALNTMPYDRPNDDKVSCRAFMEAIRMLHDIQ